MQEGLKYEFVKKCGESALRIFIFALFFICVDFFVAVKLRQYCRGDDNYRSDKDGGGKAFFDDKGEDNRDSWVKIAYNCDGLPL